MSEISQKYFTTSQFATLHSINKRTLIYYDNIGLFTPAIVKDNGYRYYTYQQSILLDVILMLKELGTPLEEIKQHLSNRTPEKLLILLYQQKETIDKQIIELNRMSKIIKNKIEVIESNKDIDYEQIYFEQTDEQYLVLSEYIGNLPEDISLKIMYKHMNTCYKNQWDSGFSLGSMICVKRLLKYDFLNYDYWFTKLSYKSQSSEATVKQKGLYLTAYCKGNWDLIPQTYERIIKFIKEHDITLKGYSYEESVIDEAAIDNLNDVITKISILIK